MQFTDGNVIGADVSLYQDDNQTPQQIDFSKMTAQGASFVIIRAGQNIWVDPDFIYNWKKAKDDGLPRGTYWFYDDRISPENQADILVGLLKDDPEELDIWVDLEKTYGGAYPGWQNWKKFITRLSTLRPSSSVGIYTGFYYISGKIPVSEYPFFSQFPLWLAWYTLNPADVKIPAPWTKCLYWQWGTPPWGIAWGCESIEIDMNKFNGTLSDFKSRYNLGGTIPPTGEEMEDLYFKVTASALNIRSSGAYETNNDLGDFNLKSGDIVHAVEKVVSSATYHKFDKLWRDGVLYEHPFASVPGYIASPTNEYWTAEKGSGVWMIETANPSPPPTGEDTIASIFKTEEIVVKYTSGKQEVFRKENFEIPKVT